MLPKMRYVSAQMGAWLKEGLWLDLARTAPDAAKRLSEGLAAVDGAALVHPTHGNEVFIRLDEALAGRLRDAGAGFYSWPDGSARFVTSWCTTDADISALLDAART
jgi:threonine aldolase